MMRLKKLSINTSLLSLCFMLIAVAVPFSSTISHAAEYFVAKTGNDANSGTKISPFLTIRKGMLQMGAGDTLYIKTGTYAERLDSQRFTMPTGNSWDDAPIVTAFPGSSPYDLVTITAASSNAQNIGLVDSYLQYIIFKGLVVDATNNYNAISMTNGANHIRFIDMEVKNATYSNILLTPGTGGTDYNEFIGLKSHDAGHPQPRGSYGLYIATDHNLFDSCEIYNNTAYGFHIYNAVDPRPSHNIVRNCRIYNNSIKRASSAGILLASGRGNMAYNNLVYNGLGHGIQVGNSSVDALVYNNTIYGNDESGLDIGPGTGSATGTIIKNNISYKNRLNYKNIGTGTVESNNIKDGTDPGLVDPGNLDWHLKSDANHKSPAIDAGLKLDKVVVDFEGNGRPQGSKYDIGAFEFNSSKVGVPGNLRVLTAH